MAVIAWVAVIDSDQIVGHDSDVEAAIDSDRQAATALNVVAVIDSDSLVESDWGLLVNLDRMNVTNSHHAAVHDSMVVRQHVVSPDVTAEIVLDREVTTDSEMIVVIDSDGATTTDSDRVIARVSAVVRKETLLMAVKLLRLMMHG
jgi:hypothetical protein